MNTHTLNHSPSEIRAEACAWLAQLDTGELTPADLDAFREWLSRSPRHAAEIQQAAHLSADLNLLADLQGPIKKALKQYQVVMERPRSMLWRPAWGALASFLVVAAFVATLVLQNAATSAAKWPLVATTAIGEYRKIDLEDGSSIEMNTDTRLKVSYGSRHRRVDLLQGEALFSVAKDNTRPFVVYAQGLYVEAVGTAFVVRRDSLRLEIMVTEGEVQVGVSEPITPNPRVGSLSSKSDSQQGARLSTPETVRPISLSAGQRYIASAEHDSLTRHTPVSTQNVDQRELARQLAWKDGLLEFSHTPLEDVIREVSRYTDLSIDIADPELRALAFGGLFRTGDTVALFDALQSGYGIRVEYTDAESVSLSRSPQE